MSNAGGPAIMATDAVVNLGLEMAPIAEATRAELRTFLPAQASLGNPIDMIASASAGDYARALEVVLRDEGVDAVIVINVTPILTTPLDVMEAISGIARSAAKPVLTVMMATEDFYGQVRQHPDHPPVYHFPESAALALSKLCRYAAWRRTPEVVEVPRFRVDAGEVRALLARAHDGYLEPADAFRILECYGIPTVRSRLVASREEVPPAAAGIGYPLVLKAVAPDVVHKSEAGAVEVDIRDPQELAEALARMEAALTRAGHSPQGYLIQELARGGHETIFGISTDPRFGPLLMFGLGGKYVEVFRDVRFGVTPLAPAEADEMIRGIRGFALLQGVRGEHGADLDFLREVLLRLAQLAQDHPEIEELDINPFLAAPDRAHSRALDVRIRLARTVS